MDAESRTELAAALGRLAIDMQAQNDPDAVLRTIVMAATELLPSISWAGVALVRNGRVTAQMPTDEVSRTLNELQDDLGEGPALVAHANQPSITIPDLRVDSRWPRFAEAAVGLGVRCLMSFRLFVEDETLGVLTIYGPQPHLFSDDDLLVGEILAQHAAVAIAGALAEVQMQAAISSRDIIGQAKGILMHRDRVSAGRAFAALIKGSQDTNVKLVDVARFVVEEFEKRLPADPRPA